MKRLLAWTLSWNMLLAALPVVAAEPPPGAPAAAIVEEIRNEEAPFLVRAEVDAPDRVYQSGEQMVVTVVSEKRGFLYLVYQSADGQPKLLFPNEHQSDHRIAAGQEIAVPAIDSPFLLRVGPPFGEEVLKAIVSLDDVSAETFGVESLTKGPVTVLSEERLKDVFVELREQPRRWAEHHVPIVTVPTKEEVAAEEAKPRRIVLVVGISIYAAPGIRNLSTPHKDAIKMGQLLEDYGRADEVIVLTNKEATLDNVRRAICETLVEKTRPGDEVIIFWSGHGARCGDESGDEKDGYDEVLALYDSRQGDLDTIRRTTLLDDTFGRWLQDLDGRRVAVILDTCHAGGQATDEKEFRLVDPLPNAPFDFLGDEMPRFKDIGQGEVAVLASSMASQKAFERVERDYSTMTYFLIRLIESGATPITLSRAHEELKVEVPRYVKKAFGVDAQTPVLISNLTEDMVLRP